MSASPPTASSGPTGHAVFACDASALDPETRQVHFTWIREALPRLVTELHERDDGIALRFAADAFPALATFVDRERRCCPFLRFTLELEQGGGPLWLRLTGPEGIRKFLQLEFALDRLNRP